jgi:hypothetical protein
MLLITAAAVIAPAPVQGREQILGDEDKGQRRLFFSGIDYELIYNRCCVPNTDGEWPDCKCPKRQSDEKSWVETLLLGEENAKTYEAKWDEQCSENGWLYKKANMPPN